MNGTVLVVNDTPAVADLLSRLVERLGIAVEVVATGEAAIERVGVATFRAILMDGEMPGIGGLQAIERLRADPAHADLPIIFHSASPDLCREASAMTGIDAILSLPFGLSVFDAVAVPIILGRAGVG